MTGTAPWITAQLGRLVRQRGHAWLLHGPAGLGQYALALELARAWLCEQPRNSLACGHCASCHQVDARTHPDLLVLMPEVLALELGWPLDEKTQSDLDEKKRKPSKEIKVEAARGVVHFAQLTRARGVCKVVLTFPAERMNQVTANTLLKTLEEPPGETRFVLASEAVHQLLPTIRSRCQQFALRWPEHGEAIAWLTEVGLEPEEALFLLSVAGGRPEMARQLHQSGLGSERWRLWPGALVRGQVAAFDGLSPAEVVDVLQKVCHDQMVLASGGTPRYFETGLLVAGPSLPVLKNWSVSLMQSARMTEHTLNPGLMIENLVAQGRIALNSKG